MASRRATKFDNARPGIALFAKNENQATYIKSLVGGAEQVIVLGPAGTGKTYIAATYASQLYLNKKIDKIILTRPNLAAGKSIGFFPGTLEEKMAPWMAPVIDVLVKHLGKGMIETGMKNGNIEIAPFETMRGRSFENAFVLLDEAQNTTVHEMKMFLTRVGEGSRVVLNGDVMQSDLNETSGLRKIIHMAKKHSLPVPVIEFTVDDIVRSDLCKLWIETFIKEGIA
jgi:phosphate starvation-inducible PhoH-like protein